MKFKSTLSYLLLFSLFFLFLGCSHGQHEKAIIELQKSRIEKLEKHSRKQARTIDKLKAKAWSRPNSAIQSQNSSLKLESLIKQKKWVSALKTSSELKKKYPNSMKVHEARVFILRKMGLFKEAGLEQKNLVSLKKNKRLKRL